MLASSFVLMSLTYLCFNAPGEKPWGSPGIFIWHAMLSDTDSIHFYYLFLRCKFKWKIKIANFLQPLCSVGYGRSTMHETFSTYYILITRKKRKIYIQNQIEHWRQCLLELSLTGRYILHKSMEMTGVKVLGDVWWISPSDNWRKPDFPSCIIATLVNE